MYDPGISVEGWQRPDEERKEGLRERGEEGEENNKNSHEGNKADRTTG